MSAKPLRTGEAVILVDAKGRRYLKMLVAGHRMTIRGTILAADEIAGLPEGSLVGGGGGMERFRALRPTHAELVPLLARPAEPIFAKDIGAILVHGDIRPGLEVVELGVGAGATTIALLRALGRDGKLTSYEIREDFAETARTNVERYLGDCPNWTIKVGDARDGIDETDVDRIFADLPDTDRIVATAARALGAGGILTTYVPTVLQVHAFHEAVATNGCFLEPQTLEMMERSWHVSGRSIRPDHRMVAHTGFLTFTRRIPRRPAARSDDGASQEAPPPAR
jgi:tRNA (adenine57-N1/adenine58-N1)-methyltransferase